MTRTFPAVPRIFQAVAMSLRPRRSSSSTPSAVARRGRRLEDPTGLKPVGLMTPRGEHHLQNPLPGLDPGIHVFKTGPTHLNKGADNNPTTLARTRSGHPRLPSGGAPKTPSTPCPDAIRVSTSSRPARPTQTKARTTIPAAPCADLFRVPTSSFRRAPKTPSTPCPDLIRASTSSRPARPAQTKARTAIPAALCADLFRVSTPSLRRAQPRGWPGQTRPTGYGKRNDHLGSIFLPLPPGGEGPFSSSPPWGRGQGEGVSLAETRADQPPRSGCSAKLPTTSPAPRPSSPPRSPPKSPRPPPNASQARAR